MMRRLLVCGAVCLALLLVTACAGSKLSREPDAAKSPGLNDTEQTEALAVYADQSCDVCHGENGEGGEGPALRNLASYWDSVRLSSYLEDPEAFREANPDFEGRDDIEWDLEMPAYDSMSIEERTLLARWLMTR